MEFEITVLAGGFAQVYGGEAAAMVDLLAAVGRTREERAVLREVAVRLRTKPHPA